MDIKSIFFSIAGLYLVYYFVMILLEYIKHKTPNKSTKTEHLIKLEELQAPNEVEELEGNSPKQNFFNRGGSFLKKEDSNQVENMIGIHLVDDNELIGEQSDLEYMHTMPVEDYLKNFNK